MCVERSRSQEVAVVAVAVSVVEVVEVVVAELVGGVKRSEVS